MNKQETEYFAKMDKMLDRWEAETKAGKDNPGKVSDPKPNWDHKKYLRHIYAR